MSVLVKCEKVSTTPDCKTSDTRQNTCPSKATTCSTFSPSCQHLLQIVPCSKTLVPCRMVQGGIVWNGVTSVHCIPSSCSTPSCHCMHS